MKKRVSFAWTTHFDFRYTRRSLKTNEGKWLSALSLEEEKEGENVLDQSGLEGRWSS